MTDKHTAFRQRQAERGKRLLRRYVPADLFPAVNAEIDRLVAEYDARKAQEGKE